jgi:hypothetical protein
VAVGHRYPVKYVWKLESMLQRHMPVPFSLTCVVDRPRKLPPSVRTVDASNWGLRRVGMRVTTDKLGLFEPGRVPFDEFLYLDTTLVIQRDMGSLLEFAFGREEELIVLRDWNYDAYNTCVMRIRTGGALAGIPKAFREGVTYPWRNPGDQDFVTAYVRDKGLESQVAIWPEDMIVSYKNAREVHRTDPVTAYRMLEPGTIVKFYGKTKMDQLLNPIYRAFKMKGPDAKFWVRELGEHWR